jgi:hypothetical protein
MHARTVEIGNFLWLTFLYVNSHLKLHHNANPVETVSRPGLIRLRLVRWKHKIRSRWSHVVMSTHGLIEIHQAEACALEIQDS